ncbi:reverse transcriptase domain-containing protein [Tanacetum coccineum]
MAERSTDRKEVRAIVEEEDNWMTPIIRCLVEGVWPEDKDERRALRMKINQYVLKEECKSKRGTCSDAETPQNIDDFNHGPVTILPIGNGHPWSFASSSQKIKVRHCSHRLLHEVDQGEAVGQDYQERRKEVCMGQHCVPVRAPRVIVTDNGTQFVNDPFKGWCESLNIKQMNTAVPHPQANGLVERANKNLMKGIKARLGRERAGWVDELPNVLWAHRTSLKQSNDEMPFSLTYGSEAMITAEIGMPTHQTMMIREDENEDELRLNMDFLQERKEAVAIREAKYKTKIEQYYNQKVRPMSFKPDEYVFQRNEASRVEDHGKLGPE